MIRIVETILQEAIADVKKYYPNIPDDIFMELIALDPTYTGKDSVGKYGKWLLNLFNRGKITENDFEEIPELLNQFTTYRNRIQNKDLNSYKTLDDLAETLASVIDDMSMLTHSQKTKFLKRVKSGKITVNKSDDYDVVLETPNFIVYVPNTHEASMKLGKGTEWCTAHENPEWYDKYTKNGHKLYIIKDKKTGERWQYSDGNDDFLDQRDESFDISELMKQDEKLSKFFAKFLGMDYCNFNGTWIYNGHYIPTGMEEDITKIIIKDGTKDIKTWVFGNCTNLTDIIIPDSVITIGESAFFNCENLEYINLPNSINHIDFQAFMRCDSLKSINIPYGVKYISNETFRDCSNLTKAIIPNSVEAICSHAFFRCDSLEEVNIPNSVRKIGHGAFDSCFNLKHIIIPDNVTEMGCNVFYQCENLVDITLSKNIKSIGNDTFNGCISLQNIVIPEGVTTINNYAFAYCESLTKLIIPNSVTQMGKDVFKGCTNLTVYSDSGLVRTYCDAWDIPAKRLHPKNESYNPLKLKIREF